MENGSQNEWQSVEKKFSDNAIELELAITTRFKCSNGHLYSKTITQNTVTQSTSQTTKICHVTSRTQTHKIIAGYCIIPQKSLPNKPINFYCVLSLSINQLLHLQSLKYSPSNTASSFCSSDTVSFVLDEIH